MEVTSPRARAAALFPGIMVAVLVAVSAQFLANHYATPAMLLALLLGIALGFLGREGRTVPGVDFAARGILRIGVALLGARISFGLIAGLGWEAIALVVSAVILTIGFGLAIAPLFGERWRFALLTSGSVAICGASAAIAINAVLPRDARSEERLIFTIIGVTVLSTLAMILYPILASAFGLDERAAGIFLGATIHDVAQVVGAGYSVSETAGDKATLVKLIRVALLAPVVVILSVLLRRLDRDRDGTARPPLLPGFVVGFLVLAAATSFGLVPAPVVETLGTASRWFLLTAIAAVGMKTDLGRVLSVGGPAIGLIVAETVFIAALILAGLSLTG